MTVQPIRLRLPDHVRRLIRNLHPEIRRKVRAGLQEIVENPYSGKALRDDLEGLYSFRVGRVRIVYRVFSRTVHIVAIGPRRTIYRETLRLIKKEE